MLLNLALLLCCPATFAEPVPATDVVVASASGGVEVRTGNYVLAGLSVTIDHKKLVAVVEGSEAVPARLETNENGHKNTVQGKWLKVDLASGKVTVK